MKTKLKEALQRGYNNLGISDEAFDGAAAFGATFITDEAQIENFVKGAEPMLKAIQSDTDKLRSHYTQRIKDLEDANKHNEPQTEPKESNTDTQNSEISKLLESFNASNKATNELIAQMRTELNQFKAAQTEKEVIGTASTTFRSNDWVKKYSDEADEAWEHAMDVYEAGGKKLTSQELVNKAMTAFNKKVAKKGVNDTTKPIENQGPIDNKPDASRFVNSLRKSGRIAKSE